MKKYEMIFKDYKNAILNGTYSDGARLPTEAEISRQYGTSRVPVQQAMNALIGNGLVKRIIGSGTYVTYKSNLSRGNKCKTVFLLHELNAETAQIMEGIQSVLHNRDIFVTMRFSHDDHMVEREVLQQLLNGEIEGLIAYATYSDMNIDLIYECIVKRLPLVFVDKLPNDMVCNGVMSDPVLAMHKLVDHLYENGHRRIAVVTHKLGKRSSANIRLKMAEMAMASYDLVLPPQYIKSDERYVENIIELMSLPEPPTAILFAAAVLARNAYPAFERLGLRVPQDISIVAHDNIKRFFEPFGVQITSVEQDYHTIGSVAADRLYEYMVSPDLHFHVEYLPLTFFDGGESVKLLA